MERLLFKKKSGYLLISVLVFGSIGAMIIGVLTTWLGTNWRATIQVSERERSFQIAEAGIEYYRWHLAHSPLDFKDGTTVAGPYVHEFRDRDNNLIGSFELIITPPLTGSTIVTILSRGRVVGSTATRAIEVKMAVPSLAKYAVVANNVMRFGEGTVTVGPIHSNGGIRFDGVAQNLVTSAKDKYTDPDSPYELAFGVHTHSGSDDPSPPASMPSRVDVFQSGRLFPLPAVDFSGFTADLAQIKTDAQFTGKYFGSSGSLGYNIILKTDNTFDVKKVTSLVSPDSNCSTDGTTGWGTWSIGNTSAVGNYPIPANGLIFAEDNVWVEGQINNSRVTIVAATFPETTNTSKSITINKDVLYTNYDGRDVISLIAQKDINVGQVSDNDLRIDAALVAKNGRAGRYYYSTSCDYNSRNSLTLYGMIATNNRYGFAYTNGTGYDTRNLIYDGNLLYGPPPSFPLTAENYVVISWREVR
ncbi:MAG: hypothetical protein WCW56_00225 [Candidatus Paceibacterota bacterium]|jgi:hypothetical protein